MAYISVTKIWSHPVTQISSSMNKSQLTAFIVGGLTALTIFTGMCKGHPSFLHPFVSQHQTFHFSILLLLLFHNSYPNWSFHNVFVQETQARCADWPFIALYILLVYHIKYLRLIYVCYFYLIAHENEMHITENAAYATIPVKFVVSG